MGTGDLEQRLGQATQAVGKESLRYGDVGEHKGRASIGKGRLFSSTPSGSQYENTALRNRPLLQPAQKHSRHIDSSERRAVKVILSTT